MIQTSDGGIMVSGHTEDFGALDCDAFLMKLDRAGRQQWFRVYGADEDDISICVIEMPDHGYVMAGTAASFGQGNDSMEHTWFVRTDQHGDTLWTRTYGSKGTDYAYSIARVPSGGFLAAGFSNGFSVDGKEEGFLLRLKDNGDTLWTRRYTTGGRTRFQQILPVMDGGFILAGFTTPDAAYKSTGLMVRLDAAGRDVWQKTYGGAGDDVSLRGVAQLPDGNFMFTGFSHHADTNGNVLVLTTDEHGNKLREAFYGGKSLGSAIAVQGISSYLVAGTSSKWGDADGDLYYFEMDNTTAGVPPATVDHPYVYPVPVTGRLTIVLPGSIASQSTTIDVTDVRGNCVYSCRNGPAGSIRVDCRALVAGTYFFHITCLDARVYKGRFIVE